MAASEVESRLFTERSRAFYGKAKVRLANLRYEDETTFGTRALDPSNVIRLQRVFKLEGCFRLEPEHHVPVLINRDTLSEALHASDIQASELKGYGEPKPLRLDAQSLLTCLHGKHRLEAAKQHFHPEDKWWVVDLYADDLREDVRAHLREEYSNGRSFGDGEIYRYLRYYERAGNAAGANKWMARLSDSKKTDVKKLQTMVEKEKSKEGPMFMFRKALDDLLEYIGLWTALKIGTFHRLLTLRCPEEMTRYISRIHRTWKHIAGGNPNIALQLDANTVNLLQGKALNLSSDDFTFVEAKWKRRILFPTIEDPQARADLWTRICSFDYCIPSLYTFLEDTKYLEPCAKILKSLLPPDFDGSLEKAFTQRHTGQLQVQLETPCGGLIISKYNTRVNFELAYRQLWLFAMRHFPELTGIQPRKDNGKPKPLIRGSSVNLWHSLSRLAVAGGFESQEILQLHRHQPEEDIAREFLQQARPMELFDYQQISFDTRVHQISQALQQMKPRQAGSAQPALSWASYSGLELAQRCGRPFEQSFLHDRKFLFLDWIYCESWKAGNADLRRLYGNRHITSFTIKRDMFHAFFGAPDSAALDLNNNIEPDDVAMNNVADQSLATTNADSFHAQPIVQSEASDVSMFNHESGSIPGQRQMEISLGQGDINPLSGQWQRGPFLEQQQPRLPPQQSQLQPSLEVFLQYPGPRRLLESSGSSHDVPHNAITTLDYGTVQPTQKWRATGTISNPSVFRRLLSVFRLVKDRKKPFLILDYPQGTYRLIPASKAALLGATDNNHVYSIANEQIKWTPCAALYDEAIRDGGNAILAFEKQHMGVLQDLKNLYNNTEARNMDSDISITDQAVWSLLISEEEEDEEL